MIHLLSNMLHVFVIFMIAIFIIGGFLAITGTFDHWNERYKLKQRRRRLRRQNAQSSGNYPDQNAPYAANRPDKSSVAYNK